MNPSSEIAWTAKLRPRATTKRSDGSGDDRDDRARDQRVVDEVLVEQLREHLVMVVLGVGRAHDDEPVADAQNVHFGAVERRERLGVHHLVD